MTSKAMLCRLISDEEIRRIGIESIFREEDVFQLKGCFLKEANKSGLVSSSCLNSLLKDLGYSDPEKVLSTFEMQATEKNGLDFMTSFQTFVSVLSTEVHSLRNSYYELDSLFASIDKGNTGYLSISDLKEILVNNKSGGFGLSLSEFNNFLKVLTFSSDRESDVLISDLKKQIIFGFPILGV